MVSVNIRVRMERPLQAKCWVIHWADWSLSVSSPKQITHRALASAPGGQTPERPHSCNLAWAFPRHRGKWDYLGLAKPHLEKHTHWWQPLLPKILGEDPDRSSLCGASEAPLWHPVSSPGRQTFSFCLLQKLELDHVPRIPKRWKSVTWRKAAKEVRQQGNGERKEGREDFYLDQQCESHG